MLNNNLEIKKRFGFTLAEILIVIGIIGVIAAITIPTLISQYQKKEYVSGLKKTYTLFNQALLEITNEAGCVGDLVCTGLVAGGTTHKTFGDEVVKYLRVIKNCDVTTTDVCMSTSKSAYYDGIGSRTTLNDTAYKFIIADGASYRLWNYANNCTTAFSTGKTGNLSKICGTLALDTNGPFKGPNNEGRDIFRFYITNGNGAILYPVGGVDDNGNGWWKDPANDEPRYCDPRWGYTNGMYCAARIMEEGWEMNY